MTNKAIIRSQFPVLSKSITDSKEVLDCDQSIHNKITRVNKIKNTSSRKVYKELVCGVYHKSIFY